MGKGAHHYYSSGKYKFELHQTPLHSVERLRLRVATPRGGTVAEQLEPSHTPLWKTVGQHLLQQNISCVPLSGMVTKRNECVHRKIRTKIQICTASSFINSQSWKTTQISTNGKEEKQWQKNHTVEYCAAIKRTRCGSTRHRG